MGFPGSQCRIKTWIIEVGTYRLLNLLIKATYLFGGDSEGFRNNNPVNNLVTSRGGETSLIQDNTLYVTRIQGSQVESSNCGKNSVEEWGYTTTA